MHHPSGQIGECPKTNLDKTKAVINRRQAVTRGVQHTVRTSSYGTAQATPFEQALA